ncbi:MAG: glycosyltransferase [Gammaproteobacteria bacterium]
MFAVQVAVMKGRGGVFTSLFHYARMFEAAGVTNVCLYRGPAGGPLREAGVCAIDAPASLTSPLFPLTSDFARVRAAVRAIGGGEPDFAMVHSDLALQNVRRLFPNAVILTRCHSDKTKRKRDADIVVTLNPDQHDRVTRELAGSRARTFMLGHPFVMQPPPKPVTDDGPLRINYVARFVPEKDPITFVRALGLMKMPRPAVRMIGDGPLLGEVKRLLAAAGLDAEFPGWRVEPLEDFTRKDILVLPSTWEGLPWLLLEAEARQVPTIASDISGNMLALGAGAYGDLFKTGDAHSLAARLDAAVTDLAVLRAKAKQGRADLAERYGPLAFWRNLQEAIRAVKERREPSA